MVIVAASRSWKETRDVMMRKYLAAEKMATETDLAKVQRKNFSTYNDFLREFTLVALRILGVTNRIMSKYFLRQFSEFDKDKILSAYQQTSKFVNTRDVNFSTVTDLAEKTVVTETLALLKEGEVIDVTGRTTDKVKKGIESLHEWMHGVDNKIERMKSVLLVMQAQVSRHPLPPEEAVVPPGVANRGIGRRDLPNEQCKYCTAMGHYVHACPKLNHDILKRRCTRSLKGEIFGPQGERVNWNSLGGMRRAVIMLNGPEIAVVEVEQLVDIIWEQLRGRGPQVNFILKNDGRDRVNATTRLGTAGRRIIRDTVMEEVVGSSVPQAEPEAGEPMKVFAAKKKFRYQIPILTIPEVDDTLSKLRGTMVLVSFQTMLQIIPRLLKGLRQLLTRRRVEIDEDPEAPEEEMEEEAPQEVANLQRSRGDLEDLEKASADIRLSLPDREGGEVIRAPPVTKLSFHALPVGKLKIKIGTHHTDALVDGGAEITLIRRDFATITGCTVNKEVTGSIRGAGREIPFTGDMFPEKCEPYIDDNPIKRAQEKDETEVQPGIRRFVWDHLHDIKDLLCRFLVYNITVSGPKSILAVPEVTILGFRCGAYGRKPDPVKTDKISQWPTPLRTTTEVRAFLGVVGFWRIFIKNFAKIAEPIWAMIREEGTMDWTKEREGAVQTLNDILTSEQVALSTPCFNDEVGRPFILETDGGPLAVGGVLIRRDEEGRERPIRFKSKTLNSGERRYSQFKKEVLAILHCLKTFQAYLFGRRFILRIDPTNVVGALKNYRPIDPTVGRWVGFIWQFDYKIERIAGIRNKADGLSRVCITPEGVEDAEPIDAFLEFEGGTLAVDNEMMGKECVSGELLIRTLEKGAPTVVAELREGPVTTRGRKEERDSWEAIVGPKEELITMAVEGGRLEDDPRMTTEELIEARCQQILKNEEVMKDIANRVLDSRMRDKVRLEEKREKAGMEFDNENDSGAINRPTGWEEAGPSQGKRTTKRKLYIGLMGGPVVRRGGKKCVCRRPSPLRKGEGIKISSDSEGEKERANVGEGGNADMGDKAQASDEEGANRGERRETWHGESEGGQDMHDEHVDGEERRESPLEGRSGHGSCEGYGTRIEIPYTYDPKNLTGGYSPIQTEDEENEEEDIQEIIKINSGDERDEISRPREERRPPMH
ncbi:hypothetical protein CBR_g12117 [Chara braunii]|uniref:Reverse transcriptase/retrotransposon-derived protein RNase H-like domain-containing protein n=1 Tax=Chara braunii TaxID=69332 RepID=A0A388KR84_CHABU|nr:hypothetical protein CBR_g12117 [Chara braunii]|eukprot:GBG72547.1 hypothetical protein CBR_g12117 [Chara braunii]